VHLLIDNDVVSTPAIRVPEGSLDEPRAAWVLLDDAAEQIPHEERRILSSARFRQFGDEVRHRVQPFVPDPVINPLWPLAHEAAREHDNLGRVVSQARHALEGQWGLSTWELPLSQVCGGAEFHWFVSHILAQLHRFRDVYNSSLWEYRRVHGLRSRTHPVPELSERDVWEEAPFWIWTAHNPRRRHLYVRRCACGLVLSDLDALTVPLPLHADGDAQRAVERFVAMESQGIRVRPRALLTTMFARLLLGDLFFHGIGGAKYDQLTDRIVQRFFGIAPPAFIVLTATVKLPCAPATDATARLQEIDRWLRDLRYNPQRHVPLTAQTAPLVAEKQRWLHADLPAARRARHQAIESLNARLQPYAAERIQSLTAEREQLGAELRAQKILDSREYSCCVHPSDALRSLLLDI
jgi:hypothetical protein